MGRFARIFLFFLFKSKSIKSKKTAVKALKIQKLKDVNQYSIYLHIRLRKAASPHKEEAGSGESLGWVLKNLNQLIK